jgi:hypothetical protein
MMEPWQFLQNEPKKCSNFKGPRFKGDDFEYKITGQVAFCRSADRAISSVIWQNEPTGFALKVKMTGSTSGV